jgi:hypothetical protein
VRWHHADDDVWNVVEEDRLADDGRLPAELRGPQAMADHQYPLGAIAVVRRGEPPPQRGRHAQRGEQISGRDRAIEAQRLPGADESCGLSGVGRQPFERAAGAPPVDEVRRRDLHPGIPPERLVLVQLHQAIGLGERQRPNQDMVGDAERHRDGRDAQRRDDDSGDGKGRRSLQ